MDTRLQFTLTSLFGLLVLLGMWLLLSDVYLMVIGVDRFQP